eukprot:gene9469-biopygen13773
MLPRSVSASWRTRFPLRNGVSEFPELSGQISQELDLGGPWPGGWCPGQEAGDAWPGPRRQPRAAAEPGLSQGWGGAERGTEPLQSMAAAGGSKRSPWRLHSWVSAARRGAAQRSAAQRCGGGGTALCCPALASGDKPHNP